MDRSDKQPGHLKYRWVWVNNALVDVSMWPENRPKSKTSLFCMALWAATSHRPLDMACTNKYSYLCKKGVEELACPDGWMYAHGSCFFMSSTTSNWANAKQDCGNRGSTLATLQDGEQWSVFQSSMAQSAHLATSYWVGASDDTGSWVWLNGISVNYSVWKPANPFEDASHCMYMDGSRNFLMGDYSCSSALYYMCQMEPLYYLRNDTAPNDVEDTDWSTTCPHGWVDIGESCYFLASSSHYTDWNNARRTCNAYHATLATFDNRSNLSPVSRDLGVIKSSNVWAGASNNLENLKLIWSWVNNALVDVSVWPKDRPIAKSTYNCMALWATTSHLPVDVACSTYIYSFLCRRGVAGVACPSGWMYSSGSCFQINNVGRTWADARHDCSSKKTTLATFDNDEVLGFLQSSMVRGSHGATTYWVGAASDLDLHHGSWTWLSGSKVLPSKWTPANAFSSSEKCMYIDPGKQFTFNDYGCGSRLNYMCQREPLYYLDGDTKPQPKPYIDKSTGCPQEWVKIEHQCYYVSDNNHATDWNNAERTCAAFHGTLAVFSNEAEIENVRKYLKLKDSRSMWVGASNTFSGTHHLWLWLDRSSVENRLWSAGYPVKKEQKMCMVLWKMPNYESRDIACTLKYPFICSQPVKELVCPVGWFFVHDSCFFLSTVAKNWNDANLNCDESGSTLAVLDEPVIYRKFVEYLAKTAGKVSTSYWIGAVGDLPSTDGEWTWINKVKVSKDAQPDSSPTVGSALLLDGAKGFATAAAPKTGAKHFVCQQRLRNSSPPLEREVT
ncbi:C-type mannose receptor 2-like [Oratosquilla oratoria]|uniref:C-type mannose receptor 2-like n=1 Tax=Oratosquilla oratoria TaxID=337810 RepID=UPI003F76A2EE